MTRALPAIALITLLRGCAVIWGAGETFHHEADLDLSEVPEIAQGIPFEEPALGWKYEYFSVFFIDFWTGGAQLVIFDDAGGNRYVPLTDDDVRTLTNREPSSFSPPFTYTVPLGWIVLAVLAIGVVIVTWLRWRELP